MAGYFGPNGTGCADNTTFSQPPDADTIAKMRREIQALTERAEKVERELSTANAYIDGPVAALRNRATQAEKDRDVYKKALEEMRFAYINKDADMPHDFETNALAASDKLLGPLTRATPARSRT